MARGKAEARIRRRPQRHFYCRTCVVLFTACSKEQLCRTAPHGIHYIGIRRFRQGFGRKQADGFRRLLRRGHS